MPTKNTGKNLKFLFGGVEIPVESLNYSVDFNEIDVTDSASPGDTTDVMLGRAKRTLKIDTLVYDSDGTELVTGTCVNGITYRVTGGTITENQGTFTVGYIFTSDGTGTLSSTNKVKPLGATLNGKSLACTVGGTAKGVTNFTYSETYVETDVTDSLTSGDAEEVVAGRAKRVSTIELVQTKEDADLLIANPSAVAVVITLGPSLTLTGSAVFKKKDLTSNSKGDAVKVKYDINWQGVVTSTLTTLLPPAVSKTVNAIWAKGSSTNKAVTGSGMITTTNIDATINSAIKATYNLTFLGAVTETVAN
jgi:hypothetical protein